MSFSMSRPIVVDLFAGAGGFSLGFEQAGFDVVAAVEIDPVHAAVHKFNFPQCAVIPHSITEITGQDIRDAAGIGNKPVDVVCGGAPCQGFSLIGQRALDDPRNLLVCEFVRIVKELQASYFVFENVKGLTVGNHKQFLDEFIKAFGQVGYTVRQRWQVLNAAHFGVPQSRERLILMGAQVGLPLPEYPYPKTRISGDEENGLPDAPTCRDALDDLPDAEAFRDLKNTDHVNIPSSAWGEPSPYARCLRCMDETAWVYGDRRAWYPNVLTSSTRTNHTGISRRRFAETLPGEVEPISRFFKLHPDRVANTLRAGTDSARGAFTSPRPIHYKYPRCITVREMARLHGFPDWFRLHQTKWHGAREVGNAVPPPLARAVASSILVALGVQPSRPERILSLGSPRWLEFDMSQASKHWEIEVPIGRRNQKSGARKRKQIDIEAERLASKVS